MLRSKILMLIATLLVSIPAAALQVSPTYQLFQLKPGDTMTGQMTLTNNEGETITLRPSVKDWYLLNVNADHKVNTWLHLDDTKEFTLKPGESRLITYKIQPQKKAKGELAGAVSFAHKATADGITMQLSVVQYAGLKGTEKLATEVAGLGINISSNTEVGVLLENTGNVHIRPRGYIYVETPKGERILNVEIPISQPAFPGQQRPYAGTVKGFTLPPGNYVARFELTDTDRPVKYSLKPKKFSVDANGKVDVR